MAMSSYEKLLGVFSNQNFSVLPSTFPQSKVIASSSEEDQAEVKKPTKKTQAVKIDSGESNALCNLKMLVLGYTFHNHRI